MPHAHKSKSKSARADGDAAIWAAAVKAAPLAETQHGLLSPLLFSSLNFFSPECPEIACRVHRDGGEQAHQERTEIGAGCEVATLGCVGRSLQEVAES